MCGIAGIILKGHDDRDYVSTVVESLQAQIHHRGPDHFGAHIRNDRGFLNRRLAIVDIAGGEQPIYGAGGAAGIVYNGEVYNYRALRERLEGRGAQFSTQSDTEVVLQGFLLDREEILEQLEGMFALCLWDERTNDIILARDAFGMKPLYLYEDGRQVIFSSELQAILALPGLDLTLDPAGFADYLTFRYTPSPNTIYRRIRRLAPGTFVGLGSNGVSVERSFCDLQELHAVPDASRDFDDAADELRELLKQSVKAHLIGEAPIALMLSGGVDSSALAAMLNALDVRMEGFNIGFPQVNEFEYSTSVAKRHNITLHNIEITPEELVGGIPDILNRLDEPVADPAQFPLYFLCADIRQFAKVVLSGEGADEIFAGYPQYARHTDSLTWRDALPNFLKASWYFLDPDPILETDRDRAGW